uniref:Putative LOC100575401 [Acyrthosiphon pisum] n=1 Tax=Lepeophtheirus salmonis TaxID=72036 RepID=A0A0K2TFH7_LEPSM
MSRGGLLQPSESFLEFCKKIQKHFIKFQENFFNTEPYVMDRLISIIVENYPKEEYEVIKNLFRSRTLIL